MTRFGLEQVPFNDQQKISAMMPVRIAFATIGKAVLAVSLAFVLMPAVRAHGPSSEFDC
jgi:hypothetical protein